MSEIIKQRIENSKGEVATIFLENGFRFKGKIINSDEQYIEILDFRTDSYKVIRIKEIVELEVGA